MQPSTRDPGFLAAATHDPADSFGYFLAGVFMLVVWSVLAVAVLMLIFHIVGSRNSDIEPFLGELKYFLSVAIMLPILALIVRQFHGRPIITLISTDARFDTGQCARSASLWFVLLGSFVLLEILIDPETDLVLGVRSIWDVALILGVILPVILAQVAAEEVVIRGYMAQYFYRLVRNRWFVGAVTTLIFVLLHGSMMSQLHVLVGIFLFLMVLRTNRLEAAIGVHFAQNVLAFLVLGQEFGDHPTPWPTLLQLEEGGVGAPEPWRLTIADGILAGLFAAYWFLAFRLGWVMRRDAPAAGPAAQTAATPTGP